MDFTSPTVGSPARTEAQFSAVRSDAADECDSAALIKTHLSGGVPHAVTGRANMSAAVLNHVALDLAISERLMRRIRFDFANDVERVVQLLGDVETGAQDRERVLAAAVLGARGDLERLQQLVELSQVDWRDLLVDGGLGNADWQRVLGDELTDSD